MAGQRIKMRRDTGANWTTANPILADGEIGYDKTAKRAKMGDGVTNWATLGYMTTADYNDLSNKPVIPATQVNSDWSSVGGLSQILNKPDLSSYQTAAQVDTAITGKGYQTAAQVQALTLDGGTAAG